MEKGLEDHEAAEGTDLVGRGRPRTSKAVPSSPDAAPGAPAALLLALQRLAGNRAVARLVDPRAALVVQRGKMKTNTTGNRYSPYGSKAIISGRKGKKPDYTVEGSLVSRSGMAHYGDSSFGPIGPEGYGSDIFVTIPDWNHTPDGTTPSVKPSWWPGKDPWWKANMVQGHLLNENLGGPGNDLRNLAPISKKANSEHLHQVEKAAKQIAIDTGKAIVYAVSVIPGPPSPGSFEPYESDTNEPHRHLIARLPKGFLCELQDEDGNSRVSFTVLNRLK
ncbi:MAG: DNA/RNA non-specific endonuclease [Acidimicrobiales bacterium]